MGQGFGFIAFGQNEFGGAQSAEPPKFNYVSVPEDNASGVPLTQHVLYEVYSYTSSPLADLAFVDVEISEDDGATYNDAKQLPYELTATMLDGHTVAIKVLRPASEWPAGVIVKIRHTAPDEFGNAAVKEYPVRW